MSKRSAVAVFFKTCGADTGQNEKKQMIVRDFAHNNNITIASFLAISNTNVRMGVEHVLQFTHDSLINIIIFDEAETLALTGRHLAEVLAIFLKEDIEVAFASENIILNTSIINIINKVLLTTIVAEKNQRSKVIKNSLLRKKRKGSKLGGRKFGTSAEESQVIQQILQLHFEGKSLQKICEMLSANEIKTVQNKKWYPTTIKRIVERSKK